MSRDTLRYLSIAGLLGIAILASAVLMARRPANLRPFSAHTFAADIDNWRQTDQWRIVETPYDFRLGPNLASLPLEIGAWKGQDIPQTNLEVFILLEPEQYIFRRYEDSAGRALWLSLIGSRKSKSFHPPQICYSTDGWQTALSAAPIPLRDGDIYALYLDAGKGSQRHFVWYFYLWPDEGRDPAAGLVLFKVTVPAAAEDTSPQEALDIAQDFVSSIFTRASRPTK